MIVYTVFFSGGMIQFDERTCFSIGLEIESIQKMNAMHTSAFPLYSWESKGTPPRPPPQ